MLDLSTPRASSRRWLRVALALGLAMVVWPVTAVAADLVYVVKRGDSLFSIAKKFGVSTGRLVERNSLGGNAYITAGQRLYIPGAAPLGVPASASRLSPAVREAIAQAPVRYGRWRYIVIHHSGTDMGTVQGMDRYHRERGMENGLAYHFVIGDGNGMTDGEVAVGKRWKEQLDGGHLASLEQDRIALGICLVGNFDKRPPTARQMASLTALVQTLMARCRLAPSAVKTHRQINVVSTRCPGSRFPTASFLAGLQPSRR